jgi:hypothetical protein
MHAAQAELAHGGQFAIMMRGSASLSDIRQVKKHQGRSSEPEKMTIDTEA